MPGVETWEKTIYKARCGNCTEHPEFVDKEERTAWVSAHLRECKPEENWQPKRNWDAK